MMKNSDDLTITENSIFTHYQVRYTITNPMPVDAIVQSLKGIEGLIKRSEPLVEKSLGGIDIKKTNVYVEEIIEGSLIYDFIVEHVIGEEEIQRAKDYIRNQAKEKPAVKTALSIGIGVMMAVVAGEWYSSLNSEESTPPAITAYNSVVINTAGDANLTKKDIEEFTDKVSKDKGVTKDVILASTPARIEKSANIELDGLSTMTVSHEIVNDIPDSIDHLTPEKRSEFYSNVDVYIYASDQDKNNTGWAGIVPDLFEKRVKFKLSENVNPMNLHGRRKIQADITVYETYNKHKKAYIVDYIELEKIN